MFSIRNNEIFLVIFLPIIALLNVVDMIEDYNNQVDVYHLLLELFQIVIVLIVVGVLLKHVYQRQSDLNKLQETLDMTRRSLANSQVKIKKLGKEYMEIIHSQFDDWNLSPS